MIRNYHPLALPGWSIRIETTTTKWLFCASRSYVPTQNECLICIDINITSMYIRIIITHCMIRVKTATNFRIIKYSLFSGKLSKHFGVYDRWLQCISTVQIRPSSKVSSCYNKGIRKQFNTCIQDSISSVCVSKGLPALKPLGRCGFAPYLGRLAAVL